ncbi:related to HNM1 - choline permease [Ustilago sp. UG-2017a]|nr:related to HNM1 - choline permease [Ustilago sp. UG-2017a]
MSPKDANSTAQITISELDRQASVDYVSDGSEEQARQYADRESGLGNKLSTLGAIALGYTSLSSWIAYSASDATALASGGANVLVWGMIIVGICNMAAAVTIAEPASQFPNASGQAAWVYRLHVLLGYLFLSVAAQLITTTILLAMINLTFPDYVMETWHVSVSIIVTAAFAFVVAGIASKLVTRLNVFAFTWSLVGLFVVVLTLLIQSRGNYNIVEFALVDITNVSGWGNSFNPWVLGLSQAALSTTALDVPTHFSEEMANPSKQVPIAIFGGLGTSIVITLAYAFLLVFTLPGLQDIVTTSTGFPFAEILRMDPVWQSLSGSSCTLSILWNVSNCVHPVRSGVKPVPRSRSGYDIVDMRSAAATDRQPSDRSGDSPAWCHPSRIS